MNTYALILASPPIILSHHHFIDKSRQDNGARSTYSMQESLSQSYGVKLSEECVGQSLLPNMRSLAKSVV